MKPVVETKPEEIDAGLVLLDGLLFRLHWFGDELSEPPSKEQKMMFLDESERMLLCTGRKVFKSGLIEGRILQIGLTEFHTGTVEAMVFTPNDAHMTPVMDRVFGRVHREPLIKGMVRSERRGKDPVLEFKTGVRWYFRIEGVSGSDRNMVGIRARHIVGDECAFTNAVCHNSRIQTALPGCTWLYAGVPNGVRTTPFYDLDQKSHGKRWSRHKYDTFINPIYQSPESRQKLIDDYGGVTTQGYVTQVLGEWGEELTSSFPPGTISVKDDAVGYVKQIAGDDFAEERLPFLLGIPSVRCKYFALGYDYGYSPDPAQITLAIKKSDDDEWQMYCRVELRRVAQPKQVWVVRHLIQKVVVGTFVGLSCDNLQFVQTLQADLGETYAKSIFWSEPGGTTRVQIVVEEKLVEASIPNKQYYTELLKKWMINAVSSLAGRKLWLFNDAELVAELSDTSERKSLSGIITYYGRKDPNSKGMLDHNRDSATYLCHAIQRGVEVGPAKDEWLEAAGWAGEESWAAPWEA